MRFKIAFSLHIHLILIGVKHINLAVVCNRRRKFIERIRSDKIIMIHKHQIIAVRKRKRGICIAGNPLILLHCHKTNPKSLAAYSSKMPVRAVRGVPFSPAAPCPPVCGLPSARQSCQFPYVWARTDSIISRRYAGTV